MPATKEPRIVPPLKWYGGKKYMAKAIRENMPAHIHRVILFAGGMQELWHMPYEGISEVVNDIYKGLTNFYTVLKIPRLFEQFERRIEATPFSQEEWRTSDACFDFVYKPRLENIIPGSDEKTMIEAAVHFFVMHRQSMSGAGESFSPTTKVRTRCGMNAEVSAWWGCIDGLRDVHMRLRRVLILNMDAVKCALKEDGKDVFMYADPPYYHDTRTVKKVYKHEMTHKQHVELLDTLLRLKAKVMISGYSNKLYMETLAGWGSRAFVRSNSAQKAEKKRKVVEMLWMNY